MKDACFAVLLLLSMSSCKVLSFFPLYTKSKEHVVERSAIEGNYLSNDSSESVYIIGPKLKSQLINKEYSIEGVHQKCHRACSFLPHGHKFFRAWRLKVLCWSPPIWSSGQRALTPSERKACDQCGWLNSMECTWWSLTANYTQTARLFAQH